MKRFAWAAAITAIWASAAGFFAAELTIPAGIAAAVLGSACGLVVGRAAAASHIRLPVLWLATLAGLATVMLSVRLLTGAAFWSAFLGPEGALLLGELLTWFAGPLLLVGLLRASSLRYQVFLVLELMIAGALFAGSFAAHRGGFINRPYALVDPLWARGYDPLPIFLIIGAAVAFVLMILAAHRDSRRRSFLDIGLVLGAVAAIFLFFPLGKLRDIPPEDGGGAAGPSESQGGPGAGGERAGDKGPGDKKGGGENRPSSGESQAEGSMSSFSNQSRLPANRPVAVVLFRDDYDPPIGYYYFRQAAFSQYNGQRLVQDTSGLADKDLAASFPSGIISIPISAGTAEAPAKSNFRTLDTTVALLMDHPRPFMLINPEVITPKANPDPTRFVRAYDVRSLVLTQGLPELSSCIVGSKSWGRALRQHYLESSADPRYASLASGLAEALKPEFRSLPFARALAVKYWLDKNGIYSLESNHEASSDPVSHFLFGDRTGHCVYFAHAACLLIRASGVPARVGAGYAVEARNRGGGSSLLVRERDAHAWPEIYLDGLGWIPLDITPEKSLAPPADAPDQGLQQMLGEMARQGAGNPKDEQQPAARGDLQELLKNALKSAGRVLAFLFAAFLVILYSAKLYRRIVPYYCRRRSLPRLAYRGGLDCLADAGRWRPYGQTREEFAAAMAGVSPSFPALTARHLADALGVANAGTDPAECLRLYIETTREVTRTTPWWRRLVGIFNPFSWLLVK